MRTDSGWPLLTLEMPAQQHTSCSKRERPPLLLEAGLLHKSTDSHPTCAREWSALCEVIIPRLLEGQKESGALARDLV